MWRQDYFTDIQREQHTQRIAPFKLADFHSRIHLLNIGVDGVGCQLGLSSHCCWLLVAVCLRGASNCSQLQHSCQADHGRSESRWPFMGLNTKPPFPLFPYSPMSPVLRASPPPCTIVLKIYANVYHHHLICIYVSMRVCVCVCTYESQKYQKWDYELWLKLN